MSTTEYSMNARFAENAPTAITDNSGGTASDTIAAIGATYDQDEVRNAIASLVAKVEELRILKTK